MRFDIGMRYRPPNEPPPEPPNEPPKPEPPPEPKLEKSPPESADGAAALMVELMSARPEFSCEPRSENPPANDVPP